MSLLSRDQFREAVLARDGHKCVICKAPAVDAHHIIERRLWPDGGYYLSNGASVCVPCHVQCERTTISCEDLRDNCGIKETILPPHLYRDVRYDKWGNPFLDDERRTPGELFHDESVQKILSSVLHLFVHHIKYPRTFHLPWSPGATKDDRIMESTKHFHGREVVATIKMDGENTSLYRDFIHARALSYPSHESRGRVKALHQQIAHEIPEGWRICGENLVAVHSIRYQNLSHFFQVFSIWNERNICLPWDETVSYAEMIGLRSVPVLYRGEYDETKIKNLYHKEWEGNECEGYVLRVAGSFPFSAFRNVVGKYVRENHVRTHGHWSKRKIELNGWKE